MKSKWIIISTLFLTALGVAVVIAPSTNDVIEDPGGSIEVTFCPADRCAQVFIAALDSATHSLDCALYDIDEPKVWAALDRAASRIEVRVVMDDDNKKEAGNRSYIHIDTKSGLMHNKFCIIDSALVTSGSMNPTFNDISRNYNNLVLISSQKLADNYNTELEELWRGEFRIGAPNKHSRFLINNTLVEQYFCPDDDCEGRVVATIRVANQSVKFMTFSFTSMPIASALIYAKNRGVSVEGVYEKRQVNAYSVFDELNGQGIMAIPAKNPTKGQLHNKVFIIDGQEVITGSYNPTGNGNKGNDENLLIIHDAAIAAAFLDQYGRVLADAQG